MLILESYCAVQYYLALMTDNTAEQQHSFIEIPPYYVTPQVSQGRLGRQMGLARIIYEPLAVAGGWWRAKAARDVGTLGPTEEFARSGWVLLEKALTAVAAVGAAAAA